jgi:hypothetical protein
MKTTIGYRTWTNSNERGYRFLYIELLIVEMVDAGREYKLSGREYDLEKLKRVRELTGDTVYFSSSSMSDQAIQFKFQSHLASDQTWRPWYACRLDDTRFNRTTIVTLSKLIKAIGDVYDIDPEAILTGLANLKAVHVRRELELPCGHWVPDESNPLDKIVIEQPDAVSV